MTTRSKILVPIDFAVTSTTALRHARAFADKVGSDLELLHIVENAATPDWAAELQEGNALMPGPVMMGLHRLAALIASEGLDPRRTRGTVRSGEAATVIAYYASEINAELIVMCSRNAETGVVEGKEPLAEQVSRLASCPVVRFSEESVSGERRSANILQGLPGQLPRPTGNRRDADSRIDAW